MKEKVFGIGLAILFVPLFSFGCSGVEASSEVEDALRAQIEIQAEEIKSKNLEIENLNERVARLEDLNDGLTQNLARANARVKVLVDENENLRMEIRKEKALWAEIEISTDPEKLVCESGMRRWLLILKEVNGVGVSLTKINEKHYYPTGKLSGEATSTPSSAEWFPTYIPPNGEFSVKAGCPCGRCTGDKEPNKIVYLIEGVDDNGHQIREEQEFFFN